MGQVAMISELMPYNKQFLTVFDRAMAYIDTGQGDDRLSPW
jgi:hypothetical protein